MKTPKIILRILFTTMIVKKDVVQYWHKLFLSIIRAIINIPKIRGIPFNAEGRKNKFLDRKIPQTIMDEALLVQLTINAYYSFETIYFGVFEILIFKSHCYCAMPWLTWQFCTFVWYLRKKWLVGHETLKKHSINKSKVLGSS